VACPAAPSFGRDQEAKAGLKRVLNRVTWHRPTTGGYPVRYIVAICGGLIALASWLFIDYGTARTSVQVIDSWVGATTGKSAVVHATIANRGVNRDRLLRVSSYLAARFVVLDHEGHEIDNLRIPADSELVLGGDLLRIEALGLAQAIKADEKFPMLFVFEHAGKVKVFARVEQQQSVGDQ